LIALFWGVMFHGWFGRQLFAVQRLNGSPSGWEEIKFVLKHRFFFFSLSLRSLWVGGNFVRFFPYFFISRGVFDGKGAARQWRRPTRENQQIIIAFFLVLLGLTWFSWVFLGFDEFH